MKRQLTPIPPHIKIIKCPTAVAEGAVDIRIWHQSSRQPLLAPGCKVKQPKPTGSAESDLPTLF